MAKRKKVPQRTQVEILKPEGSAEEIVRKYGIDWRPGMDKYVGTRALVYYDETSFLILSNLYGKDELYNFNWHPDWVKVISLNESGEPEPFDNNGQSKCLWCSHPTKMIREKLGEKEFTINYCPKCGR